MWRYHLYYDKHLRDRKNVLFNRNDLSKKERSDWSQNYTERAFYCYSEDIDTVSVQKFVKVKRLVLCKIIIIIIIIIMIIIIIIIIIIISFFYIMKLVFWVIFTKQIYLS